MKILSQTEPRVHLADFRVRRRTHPPAFPFDYQLACYDDGVAVILTPLSDGVILELYYHSEMPVENLDHPYRVAPARRQQLETNFQLEKRVGREAA
jgi:hypothetical protein